MREMGIEGEEIEYAVFGKRGGEGGNGGRGN